MIERFEDVLDEGLDAITSGRTDVEHFLDAHPAAADELHAALEAATAVHRATAVEPQPAFRQVARASFADKIQARSNRSWFAAWAVALRPIAVGLVAIVIVSSLGFGTAAASADAAPGQPLYGFKLAQENFRLAIARDDLDRAALRAVRAVPDSAFAFVVAAAPLIMRLLRLAQEEYQRTLQSVRTES